MGTLYRPVIFNGKLFISGGKVWGWTQTQGTDSCTYQSTLLNGLLAYYDFEEESPSDIAADNLGVHDMSIYDIKGYQETGIVNNCMLFQPVGASSYGVIDTSIYDYLSEFSVSVWIKSAADIACRILHKGDSTGATTGFFLVQQGDKYVMGFEEAGEWSGDIYNVSTNCVRSESNITQDQWQHVVGTYTHNKLQIYINSASEYDYISDGYWISGTGTQFAIAKRSVTDNAFYDGHIDELGFWNRALTPLEVSTLYNEGNGLSYPFTPKL